MPPFPTSEDELAALGTTFKALLPSDISPASGDRDGSVLALLGRVILINAVGTCQTYADASVSREVRHVYLADLKGKILLINFYDHALTTKFDHDTPGAIKYGDIIAVCGFALIQKQKNNTGNSDVQVAADDDVKRSTVFLVTRPHGEAVTFETMQALQDGPMPDMLCVNLDSTQTIFEPDHAVNVIGVVLSVTVNLSKSQNTWVTLELAGKAGKLPLKIFGDLAETIQADQLKPMADRRLKEGVPLFVSNVYIGTDNNLMREGKSTDFTVLAGAPYHSSMPEMAAWAASRGPIQWANTPLMKVPEVEVNSLADLHSAPYNSKMSIISRVHRIIFATTGTNIASTYCPNWKPLQGRHIVVEGICQFKNCNFQGIPDYRFSAAAELVDKDGTYMTVALSDPTISNLLASTATDHATAFNHGKPLGSAASVINRMQGKWLHMVIWKRKPTDGRDAKPLVMGAPFIRQPVGANAAPPPAPMKRKRNDMGFF